MDAFHYFNFAGIVSVVNDVLVIRYVASYRWFILHLKVLVSISPRTNKSANKFYYRWSKIT